MKRIINCLIVLLCLGYSHAQAGNDQSLDELRKIYQEVYVLKARVKIVRDYQNWRLADRKARKIMRTDNKKSIRDTKQKAHTRKLEAWKSLEHYRFELAKKLVRKCNLSSDLLSPIKPK